MKKIETIIIPSRLEAVKNALAEIGIEALTTSEVKGYGRQNEHSEVFRGRTYPVNSSPKVKIEIMLSDVQLEPAVAAISQSATPSNPSDNKIFVSQVEDALCLDTPLLALHAR